jgi:hypothetical protein
VPPWDTAQKGGVSHQSLNPGGVHVVTSSRQRN